MAAPPQGPSEQSRGGGVAAAPTVAAPAVVSVGSAGAAAGVVASGAVIASAIMATLATFLVALREMHRRWMLHNLGRYGQRDDIAAAVAQEQRFEELFAQRSADRLASAIPQALAITDPTERTAKLRGLLAIEQRYAQQRSEAMAARAIAAVTRHALRRESPLGAYWRLGVAENHTQGCKIMAGGDQAGSGRFWPWAVLDRVYPPRHHGCTSSLHGLGEAIAAGWMSFGDVPGTRAAVRAAAGVMMEGDVDAVLAELDVRDGLVEQGVDGAVLAGIPFVGVGREMDDGSA